MGYGIGIDAKKWITAQHANTNHMYDEYIPYVFHLNMVVDAYKEFKHLLAKNLYTIETCVYRNTWESEDVTEYVIEYACWGHDLLEDTRLSYNQVRSTLDGFSGNESYIADIIYALTNEKGKNRKERANAKYYEGIRNTPGAVFVKLCDRIANVRYSKMTKSKMFDKYASEQPEFEKMLGRYTDNKDLEPMFVCLNTLLFQ